MGEEAKEKYISTINVNSLNSTAYLVKDEEAQIKREQPKRKSIYNPFEHRIIEHPNSYFGALVHLLKASLCTGVLAMPMAFRSSGLATGLVGTILVGFLCLHTVHLLVAASQEICARTKTPTLAFAETAEAVFKNGPKSIRGWSTFARYFVDTSLFLTYYFSTAVYIVFISTQIKQVVDHYHPEWQYVPIVYYMLITMALLTICCQVRELKHLVPFSFIANVTVILAFSITLYYMFKSAEDLKISEVSLAKPVNQLPLFFVTVLYGMEGIGTVLHLENSLKKPEQFLSNFGILNVGMACVTIFYSIIGFFGYLKFKEDVQASVVQNLPPEDALAQVAKICISISIFFTFMLQFYVPADITWRKIVSPRVQLEYHNHAQVIMRIVLVVVVTAVAACVPDLAVIIDLVGAVCFSTLGLFIPAVIDTIIKWEGRLGVCHWRLYKNLFIIFISIFAMISGSVNAIQKLLSGEE